jgi:hypothetical protein
MGCCQNSCKIWGWELIFQLCFNYVAFQKADVKNQQNLSRHIVNLNRMCPQVVLNFNLKFQQMSKFLPVGKVHTQEWSPWPTSSEWHQDHHINQTISSEYCYHDVGFPRIPSSLSILAAPVGSYVANDSKRAPQQPSNKEESSLTGYSNTTRICMAPSISSCWW